MALLATKNLTILRSYAKVRDPLCSDVRDHLSIQPVIYKSTVRYEECNIYRRHWLKAGRGKAMPELGASTCTLMCLFVRGYSGGRTGDSRVGVGA